MHHLYILPLALAASVLLACAPPEPEPATRVSALREVSPATHVTLPGLSLLDANQDGRGLYGKLSPALPGSDAGLSYTLQLRDARGALHPLPEPAAEALLHPTRPWVVYLATNRGPLLRHDVRANKSVEIHPGPNFTGLAARGERVLFTAGVAPDFDVFVAQGLEPPVRWTSAPAPRWQPYFLEGPGVGFVTQEFGRPSVVTMSGANHEPKLWAHQPALFPTRAPAPRLQGGRLYFAHSGGVAALDAQGAVVWRQDQGTLSPKPGTVIVLDASGKEVRP